MKQNILYFSDNYAKNVTGTKISVFNEMKRRGCKVIWKDKKLINQAIDFVEEYSINQVWLVHSGLIIDLDMKNYFKRKNIPVIGFGMSDPNYFNAEDRLHSYDIYITNSIKIYNEYNSVISCIYNPTSCDFNFHKYKNRLKKSMYCSMIGVGKHPFMDDELYRIKMVEFLKNNDISLKIFGRNWSNLFDVNDYVEGNKFLEVIHGSNIGLDLQNVNSPLAHRIFEYLACGTPIITRKREEVLLHFEENKEILFYESKEDLLDKLKYYNKRCFILDRIGHNAYLRCQQDHNISNRIDHILSELNKILGDKIF